MKDWQSQAHVHLLLSVRPRYSIAMIIGYLRGKSAIRIHRDYAHQRGSLFGHSSWSRGYCFSTVGYDEESIRRYIEEQEDGDDGVKDKLYGNTKARDLFFADQDGSHDDDRIKGDRDDRVIQIDL